jgi:hypothetical protein
MIPRLLVPVLLVIAACRPASLSPPSSPPQGPEVWVDGAWREGGDGTRERPFRTLAEGLAVRPAPTVHVAPGLYAGPFLLPADAHLVGEGESTVLYVEGREPVVRMEAGASLERLTVQGGGWGVETAGALKLERVAFSGQREGAVRMSSGGRLVAERVQFEASLSETVGVLLEGKVIAEVKGSTFLGPWRRGVFARGGAEAVLEGVSFRGAVTGLEQEGGRVRLRQVTVEEGRGPGLFVREGALEIEDGLVVGHEYGLATYGAKLEVRGFSSVKAERAGLGLTRSTGRLEELQVRQSGSFGALQLVDSDMEVRNLRVDNVDAYGVLATRGKLRLRNGTLTRVSASEGYTGDALHLRGVVAELEGLQVREASGAGVLAAQGAEVTLRDVTLSRCKLAGLLVESQARVKALGLEVRDTEGTALAVLRDGDLWVDALSASGLGDGLIWAECEGATRVHLGRLHTEDRRGLSAPCIGTAPLNPSSTSHERQRP